MHRRRRRAGAMRPPASERLGQGRDRLPLAAEIGSERIVELTTRGTCKTRLRLVPGFQWSPLPGKTT
jgi:hypothetical protein